MSTDCPDCHGRGIVAGANDDHGHYGTTEPCRSCDGTGKAFDWNSCPDDPQRRPEFFRRLLPHLAEIAKGLGYSLTSHGSMERDFDLIAVPWTEQAVPADELAKAVQLRACRSWGAWKTERKPHGRIGYVLHISTDAYLDLSVMPRAPESPAKEQPGEQIAAPQVESATRTGREGPEVANAPSHDGHAAGPAVAAPHVASPPPERP